MPYNYDHFAASQTTAQQMVDKLQTGLKDFDRMALKVYRPRPLAGEEAVYVTFASVPKGASELEALNSKVGVMISITARGWKHDEPAPEKVQAETFRSHGGLKMRAKTDSPDKVVDYIIKFFKANKDKLLG